MATLMHSPSSMRRETPGRKWDRIEQLPEATRRMPRIATRSPPHQSLCNLHVIFSRATLRMPKIQLTTSHSNMKRIVTFDGVMKYEHPPFVIIFDKLAGDLTKLESFSDRLLSIIRRYAICIPVPRIDMIRFSHTFDCFQNKIGDHRPNHHKAYETLPPSPEQSPCIAGQCLSALVDLHISLVLSVSA